MGKKTDEVGVLNCSKINSYRTKFACSAVKDYIFQGSFLHRRSGHVIRLLEVGEFWPVKSEILGFGFRISALGIRNSAYDWNAVSKFH